MKSKRGQLRGVYTCAGLVLLGKAERALREGLVNTKDEQARPLQQLHYLRVTLNVADTVRVDGIDKILLFNERARLHTNALAPYDLLQLLHFEFPQRGDGVFLGLCNMRLADR